MRSAGRYRSLIPVDYGISPKQVRLRLVEYGVTITEFAEMVGVGVDHMSNILNEHRNASLVVRLRMQDVLKALHEEYTNSQKVG